MPYKTQAIIYQAGQIRANVLRTDDLGQTAGHLSVTLDWRDGDTFPKLERRAERKLERREDAGCAARAINPEAVVDLEKPVAGEDAGQ